MKFEPLKVDEYRIIERDKHASLKHSFSVGTQVKASRYVHRVGYLVHPKGFTYEEWFNTGLDILAEETKLPKEHIEKVIIKLNLYSPLKGIKNKIYHRLVSHKKTVLRTNGEKNLDLRSMWFVDKEISGLIVRRVNRWTGYHNSGYYGSNEYEPATLSPMYAQRLYIVSSQVGDVLVYPDDILILDK